MLTINNVKNEWKKNEIYRVSILVLLGVMFVIFVVFLNNKLLDFLEKILLPCAIALSTYLYNKNQTMLENKRYNRDNYYQKIECIKRINNYLDLLVNDYQYQHKDTDIINSLKKIEANSLLVEVKIFFGGEIKEEMNNLLRIIYKAHLNIKTGKTNEIDTDTQDMFHCWQSISDKLENLLYEEFYDTNGRLKF